MVPLTTLQGMTAAELRARVGERPLLVWGCGDVALDVVTSLGKAGLRPQALLHTVPREGPVYGLPVRGADDFLPPPSTGERPFIVIAAASYAGEAVARCLRAGLRRDDDFVTQHAIARPQAIVAIADGAPQPVRLMPPERFAAIVDKLVADLPLLTHLEFALAGDPLAHPDLPAMVRHATRVVPCTVVTRLAGEWPLAAVVDVEPHRLDIMVGGYGEAFDPFAASGRDWPAVVSRLAELRRAIDRRRPRTRVALRLERRRIGHAADLTGWRELLQGSGIELAVHNPYVMPYDELLARCRGEPLSARAAGVAGNLPWSLDKALVACADDAGLPCLSQRMFPVIDCTGAVSTCHLYSGDDLADNYLTTGWSELLARRHAAPRCRDCQAHGLHRLDLDVLERRHPQQDFTEK